MPAVGAAAHLVARNAATVDVDADNLAETGYMPAAYSVAGNLPEAARTPVACRTRQAYSLDTDAAPLAQAYIRQVCIHTVRSRSSNNNKGPGDASPRPLRKPQRKRIKTKPPTLP